MRHLTTREMSRATTREMTRSFVIAAASAALCAVVACGRDAPPVPASLTVSRAFVVRPAGESPAALYATFTNSTTAADTLHAVELASTRIMLHGPMPDMAMLDAIPVAAGATERLAPGGRHGMITGLGPHARGDALTVIFRFAHGGAITATARVIAYADVDTAAPPVR